MRVRVGNVIAVEKPSPELLHWCHTNLILRNPDYTKKVRMNLWVGNTPKDLYLYEINGNTLILPFGTLREILPMIAGAEVCKEFVTPRKIDYDCAIPLYDYQEKAVSELIKEHYGILQSPAGSGKTQMGIAIAARHGCRTLWLTHTQDLLTQSMNRAKQYMNPDVIGTITNGKVNMGSGITFATVQTMCRLDLQRYKDYWDVIIVDECHRCAGTPTAVSQFSKVLNNLTARHKYGLSATVHRADGMIKATYALLGGVVYTVPESDVADKIMTVGIRPINTGVRISRECLNTDGTLNYTKLISYLCNNEERTDLIANYIFKGCKYSSLILSDRLEHLSNIIDALPLPLQENAVMISGKMTSKKEKKEREQAIEDMRQGKKMYLFATYSLAKEGLDIPCLERLYLTTPQKDYAVITQSIGRIARTFEGKQDPVCFDFVDDIGYLVKAYKKRCSTYKKNGCYFIGGNDDNS